MEIKVLAYEAEEGGYWAEVPALPGCATQGETMDELVQNVREAVRGYLNGGFADGDSHENRPLHNQQFSRNSTGADQRSQIS
jgi:predicted RNase H-like HicB family nuclease